MSGALPCALIVYSRHVYHISRFFHGVIKFSVVFLHTIIQLILLLSVVHLTISPQPFSFDLPRTITFARLEGVR